MDLERLKKHITVDAEGCWICDYSPGLSFALIKHNGKRVMATRWIWEEFFEKIPRGMQVHHHCGIRRCVNPNHLYLKANNENEQEVLAEMEIGKLYGTGGR